jgi:hypothetical protein
MGPPLDDNAPSSSSSASISHQAALSTPSLTRVAPPMAPDQYEQPPHWDHMRQQLLRLPVHLPHCLPYIIDETVLMTPEESQSAIQARGMCTNLYDCLRGPY